MIDLAKYVGLPYKPGGRDRDGIDCYGLVWLFYRDELGIALPRYEGSPDLAEMEEVSRIIHGIEDNSGYWIQVPREEAVLGDVVDVSLMGGFHVGIFIPKTKMLHAMQKTATAIEDFSRVKWRTRIRGCFRRV